MTASVTSGTAGERVVTASGHSLTGLLLWTDPLPAADGDGALDVVRWSTCLKL
ncbi:MAG TPA: hypothetical protein PKV13_00035 [Propionicimonas sp.]|nr:hypothetical protein [Propionicimonas sp.]